MCVIFQAHRASRPFLLVAKIQPNFAAIVRDSATATAMAPNPAHRKVYVIGVGMTKVSVSRTATRIAIYSFNAVTIFA